MSRIQKMLQNLKENETPQEINKPGKWEIYDLIHQHISGAKTEDQVVDEIAGRLLNYDMTCKEMEDMLGHFKVHCDSQSHLNTNEAAIQEYHHGHSGHPGRHHHYPKHHFSSHHRQHFHSSQAAARHMVHHHHH